MSQQELRKLYKYTKEVEQGINSTVRPFSDTFKTVYRFIASAGRFKRAHRATQVEEVVHEDRRRRVQLLLR